MSALTLWRRSASSNQINRAMAAMDLVTQRNASASEELASTAEEISSQALAARIRFFRTGAEDVAVTRASGRTRTVPIARVAVAARAAASGRALDEEYAPCH